MRRNQALVVVLGALAMLLTPIPGGVPAEADDHFRIEGTFRAFLPPDAEGPLDPEARVTGPAQMRNAQLEVVIDCRGQDNVEEIVTASLDQLGGHRIGYTRDDDQTDGFGEIGTTDDAREFESVVATEVREDGASSPAAVRARLVPEEASEDSGRFHRILRLIEIHASMDVRVVRNPGTGDEALHCHEASHRIRIIAHLIPAPLDGSYLIEGEIRNEEPWVVRAACDVLQPHSPFDHVCPPYGE